MIKLLELRTEKALSQRDMAKILNVSQGTYNNWENEKTQPSIEQLICLAHFFAVSVDYLIGNTEEYGTTIPIQALTEEERKILKKIRTLNESSKNAIIGILDNL